MATWPATLPQSFEPGGWNYAPQSGVIRTQMDTGYPKVRKRFTAFTNEHSGTMIMSKTLYEGDFLTFFETTIAHGSLSFDFPNQFDDGATTVEVRWYIEGGSRPYSIKQRSPETVEISFALEELPS